MSGGQGWVEAASSDGSLPALVASPSPAQSESVSHSDSDHDNHGGSGRHAAPEVVTNADCARSMGFRAGRSILWNGRGTRWADAA
jgi:hypothetical protein